MRETIFTCDHCGKKLDDMKDYINTEFDTIDQYLEMDLCRECYAEISDMITQFCRGKINEM